MSTKVKICGITNLPDALAACKAGADALGFNFAEEAKPKNRYIAPSAAMEIADALPPFVTTVAVCVNDSLETMRGYLEFMDAVQLHGDEPPEVCAELGNRTIKAFRTTPGFDFDALVAYPVAAHLLDAYLPGEAGGTGALCDWDTAAEAARKVDCLILAGGLTPDNVSDAVRRVHPYAVDTAGGVETEPGKKDHERLRDFIHAAKA